MIELWKIEAARARIADVALRGLLVGVYADGVLAEICLKLGDAAADGSFEVRG